MSVSAKKGRNFIPYYRNEKPLTVDEVKTFPCVAVPQQDIITEDAEFYGVRSEYSQEDGTTLVASYFPYYNQDGKLTGYKRRDWTKDKEEHGHFTVVGVVKVTSQLFGQHVCKTNKNGKIYYTEGEGCCIATRRALLDSLKGTKYEGKIEPNVVSVNCGVGNASVSTAHNEDFIRSFKEIVCLFDNDEATEIEKTKGVKKGREGTEDVASFLLAPNFYVVTFPESINDCREWVKKDSAGFAKEITWNIKKYSPEKILSTRDLTVADLRKKKKRGIPLRHLKKLQEKTKSPIKSELWSLTAPSGAGKSTIVRDIEFDIASYLMYGLKDNDLESFREDEIKVCDDGITRLADYEDGERLGIIRLEEGSDESLNSLYAMDLGVDPKKFVEDTDSFVSEEEHLRVHEKWQEKDCLMVLDHFGSLAIDSLISKLKQMMAFGCRWFILDHYTMLVSGMRTSNDVKELDIIMTELAAFCQQYGVFILGVSHMKRKNIDPPKDKETGDQLPFFYPVRKEDMRGSAALEQLSWVVILLEPEELPDRSRGRVRLVVAKNRRGKVLGVADTLWQNEDGTYKDASEWEVDGVNYVCNGEIMHCFSDNTPQIIPEPIKSIGVDGESYQDNSFVEQTGLILDQDGLDEPF
ncbi:DNA primase/helicase [Vibrio phage S4-7]|nr:DNA primase/helicase [Vibrio phage S4-7]